jgi:hypothetical protein
MSGWDSLNVNFQAFNPLVRPTGGVIAQAVDDMFGVPHSSAFQPTALGQSCRAFIALVGGQEGGIVQEQATVEGILLEKEGHLPPSTGAAP